MDFNSSHSSFGSAMGGGRSPKPSVGPFSDDDFKGFASGSSASVAPATYKPDRYEKGFVFIYTTPELAPLYQIKIGTTIKPDDIVLINYIIREPLTGDADKFDIRNVMFHAPTPTLPQIVYFVKKMLTEKGRCINPTATLHDKIFQMYSFNEDIPQHMKEIMPAPKKHDILTVRQLQIEMESYFWATRVRYSYF